MLEPAPKKISLPTQESNIKVGLILPEDKLEQVSISSKQSVYLNDLLVEAKNANFLVRISEDKLELAGNLYSQIQLKPVKESELTKNCGFLVSPVMAGRNFHWKKQISASYPGELQLSVEEGRIKLINILPFEKYLTCVATSEMSSDCPAEFMKAQIIAARSWAYVFLNDKHPDSGFDVCNDDDCQRYQGTTFLSQASIDASSQTSGLFLQDNLSGHVLPAYYIKTCGGFTEKTSDIFGFKNEAIASICDAKEKSNLTSVDQYLSADPDSFFCGQSHNLKIEKYLGKVDSGGSHFRWSKKIKLSDLRQNLQKHLAISDFSKLVQLKTIKTGSSFRITELDLIYISDSGQTKSFRLSSQYQIRQILSPDFLPSSAFTYNIDQQGDITYKGAGWGHGVGLCQVGAVVMALNGYNAEQILKHYFPNSEIVKAY